MLARAFMAIVATLSVACTPSAFLCESASDCTDRDIDGQCEPSGYCSFPDPACATGSRYGTHAPENLAEMCVPVEPATIGGEETSPPPTATSHASHTTTAASVTDGDTEASLSGVDGTQSATTTPDDGVEASDEVATTPPDESESSTTEPVRPDSEVMTFGNRSDADVQDVAIDAFLHSTSPDLNMGLHADVHIAGANGTALEVSILRFELAELPAGATVITAQLELTPYDVVDDGLVEVFALGESWSEGDQDWAAGVCNWTMRTTDVAWSSPGGTHDDELLGSFVAAEPYTTTSIDLAPWIIEQMRDDPEGNHGFLLRSTDHSGTWFASREEPDEQMRPLLRVRYVP